VRALGDPRRGLESNQSALGQHDRHYLERRLTALRAAVAGACGFGRFAFLRIARRLPDGLANLRELGLAAAVGEKAAVANPHEALGQNVQ